jgi:hypothetical protein
VKGDKGGDDVGLPGADTIAFWALSKDAPFKFYLTGLEFYLRGSIRLSPNVEWVRYDEPAGVAEIQNDVVTRLTFYWSF